MTLPFLLYRWWVIIIDGVDARADERLFERDAKKKYLAKKNSIRKTSIIGFEQKQF